MAFFDTSVLVALLFEEGHSPKARDCWLRADERCGSILLETESRLVVRRIQAHIEPSFDDRLTALLAEVTLREFDRRILALLMGEPKLAGCRALDAIHLATALEFRANSDEPLTVFTFDERMARAARELGFDVAGSARASG